MSRATKANVTKAMNAAGIPGTIWYSRETRIWYAVDKLPVNDDCCVPAFWAGQYSCCLDIVCIGDLTTDQVVRSIKMLIEIDADHWR